MEKLASSGKTILSHRQDMKKEGVKIIRQSNFELLRIISMLLVVATHVNFYSLGWPSKEVFASEPSITITKLLFESISICCVNVFVLISGWFGIKPSVLKFKHFLFQCFFFSFGLLFLAILFHKVHFGFSLLGEIGNSLFLRDYWFITSYILLYLLAPVLNAFIDNASQKSLLVTIVCFLLYEIVYGWIFQINGINRGYSTISFIGLYLLAAYLRRFSHSFTRLKPSVDFSVFLCSCLLNTLVCIVMLKTGYGVHRFFNYTCPFVIISSVSLLLCFSKITFYSKAINYIASSAISVYLFHQNHFINSKFREIAIQIFNNNGSITYFIMIFLYIICMFIIAVMLDQIRKAIDYFIIK